jgi:hypothetical protein
MGSIRQFSTAYSIASRRKASPSSPALRQAGFPVTSGSNADVDVQALEAEQLSWRNHHLVLEQALKNPRMSTGATSSPRWLHHRAARRTATHHPSAPQQLGHLRLAVLEPPSQYLQMLIHASIAVQSGNGFLADRKTVGTRNRKCRCNSSPLARKQITVGASGPMNFSNVENTISRSGSAGHAGAAVHDFASSP